MNYLFPSAALGALSHPEHGRAPRVHLPIVRLPGSQDFAVYPKAGQWGEVSLPCSLSNPPPLSTSTSPTLPDPPAFDLLQAAFWEATSLIVTRLSKPHPHLRKYVYQSSLKLPDYGELLNFCFFLHNTLLDP